MSNAQKQAIQLIKSLSGQANVLTIPRVYIDLVGGDVEAALFLSQCVYWSDKTINKYGFYKSIKEWQGEIGLSRFKVARVSKLLTKWVSVSKHRANNAPTLHYKVNFDLLLSDISDLLVSYKSDLRETSKSITETTQRLQSSETPKGGVAKNATLNNNRFPMMQLLADVCGLDLDANKGMIGKSAKNIEGAGYTVEQVKSAYQGERSWWNTQDWRGKKGERPNISLINQTIKLATSPRPKLVVR